MMCDWLGYGSFRFRENENGWPLAQTPIALVFRKYFEDFETKIVMNHDVKNVIYRVHSLPLVWRPVSPLCGRQAFGACGRVR